MLLYCIDYIVVPIQPLAVIPNKSFVISVFDCVTFSALTLLLEQSPKISMEAYEQTTG